MIKAERMMLEALIESVADGTPVDWAAVEAEVTTDAELSRVRNLRLVARVTDLQRTLTDLEDEADDGRMLAPAPAAAAPVRWGHLEVGEPLGQGSCSDVYRARDPQLNLVVALKVLRADATRPGELERLLVEPRALAQLRHPNVVAVYGAREFDGRAGLWMELVDGQTLKERLTMQHRFNPDEAVCAGMAVCRALAAVHGAGLVHGDVKAQNIMRETETGRLVLMDFGAGRPVGGGPAAVAGTPLYAAPEILAGVPPTAASDIYSAGVLLFHLLTGRYPYEAVSLDGLRTAHAEGRRLHLRDARPGLPRAAIEVVEGALERDPGRRFATAGAMEEALAASISGRVVRGQPRAALSRWVLGPAAAVAMGLVAGIAVQLRTPSPIPDGVTSLLVVPFTGPAEAGDLVLGFAEDVTRQLQRYDVKVSRLAHSSSIVAAGLSAPEPRATIKGEVGSWQGGSWLKVSVENAGHDVVWNQDYALARDWRPRLPIRIAADIAAVLKLRNRDGYLPPTHLPGPAAYEAYVRGREAWNGRSHTALSRALSFFERAVALDPEFAEAWAGLSDVYMSMGVSMFGDLTPAESRRRAREPALRALRLNPDLAEAETSLGFAAYFLDWNWSAAEEHFTRAMASKPDYALAHHWYADYLNAMGRDAEAINQMNEARGLEPDSIIIDRDMAWPLFFQRRYDEAIDHLAGTLARDPNYVSALTLRARALAARGRFDEAVRAMDRALALDDSPASRSTLAYVLAVAGNHERAAALVAALEAGRAQHYLPAYYLALAHHALGNQRAAIGWLRQALVEQDQTLVNLRADPRFDGLRENPDFRAIVAQLRFPAR